MKLSNPGLQLKTLILCPKLCVLAAFVVISGCATTTDETAVKRVVDKSKLTAMEKPVLDVGYTLYRRAVDSDEEESWSVTEIGAAGEVTAKNSDGCIWQVNADWVPPNISWKDCGSNPKWNSGTRTVTETTGSIWPLQVGNRASFSHEYEFTSGVTGSGVRDCEVTTQEEIEVPMGKYNAFVIECTDNYSKHSELTRWYFAPGVGEVKYMREHSENGIVREVEAVRIEPAVGEA